MPSEFINSVKCSGNLSSRAAALGGAGQAHQHGQVMPPGGGGGGQHPPHVSQAGGGDPCVLEEAEEHAGGQLTRPAGDGGLDMVTSLRAYTFYGIWVFHYLSEQILLA